MKEYKVSVQQLIDHIKTAMDVDPWAKEMAEELLKKNEAVKPLSEHHLFICPMCKKCLYREQKYCDECGQAVKWDG